MAKDKNKGYASVRIKEGTLEKLQKLRDKLRLRDRKERIRQCLPMPTVELSVNQAIEWLLYREACEAARQSSYKRRKKA